MGTQTYRPNGNAGGTCVNGLVPSSGGQIWSLLNDNSDATYGELQFTFSSMCGYTFNANPGPFTLPAYAQVRSLSVRARAGDTSGLGNYNYPNGTGLFFQVFLGATAIPGYGPYKWSGYSYGANPQPWPQGVISTVQFGSAAIDPSFGITQADIDQMVVIPHLSRLGATGPLTPAPRLYELYVDLVYNLAPTVAVSAPSTTVSATSRPTIIAVYSDAESDTLDQYRVRIYTLAQTQVIGFDPESGTTPIWDSGFVTPVTPILAGGTITQQVGIDLPNNTTYVAYVKASDVGSGARFGGWGASVSWLLSVAPPAAPAITVTPDSVLNRVALNLLGFDNELTRNQANAETATQGWFPQTNVASTQTFSDGVTTVSGSGFTSATAGFSAADLGLTITGTNIPGGTLIKTIQSATSIIITANATASGSGLTFTLGRQWPRRQTTQSLIGLAAFVMRSAASGTVAVRTVSATTTAAIQAEAVPVKASTQYTALASFRQAAVAAGRTARVDIAWYDSTGTIISTITTGTAVAITSTAWAQALLTATSPSNAAYAVVILNVLGGTVANEDTYYDTVGLAPGASTTWARGGSVQALSPGLDTFTRADNAASMGNATVGGAWTGTRGTWGIQSNQAYAASGLTSNVPTWARLSLPSFIDGTVTCDVKLSGTRTDAFIFMRGRLASEMQASLPDCVLAEIAVNSTTTQLNLFQVISGAATVQQLATSSLILGTTVGVKLECIGDKANLYFDRKDGKGFIKAASIVLAATDLASTTQGDASMAGFGIGYTTGPTGGDDAATRFDNFVTTSLVAPQLIVVERSIDGGVTWQSVRSAYLVGLTDPGQFGTFYDYETPRGAAVLWRAKVQITEITDVLTSPYSSSASGTLANDGNAWLKSPSDPTKNIAVTLVKDSLSSKSEEDMAVFAPLGRPDPLIHGGTVRLEEFDGVEIFCANDAAWNALETLRARKEPLLLQTCYGDASALNEQFWVRLGPSRQVSRLTMSTAVGQLRRVKIPARQVATPSVP